ncbi:MAG: sulfatase-like hydrolase/transferase [Acidobacteriia bacterium]|nr:sulfatase-like hydrolase/transferase [Terriglobia bacterium]
MSRTAYIDSPPALSEAPASAVRTRTAGREWFTDLAVGFSFSNLCYLRVWTGLLDYNRVEMFSMKAPPRPVEYLAAIANVLLLGALCCAAIRIARQPHGICRIAARAGLVLAGFAPLNSLRDTVSLKLSLPMLRFGLFTSLGKSNLIIVSVLAGALMALVVLRWHRVLLRTAYTTLLILFAFVPMTFGQAAWAAGSNTAGFGDQIPGNRVDQPRHARVLWIIFDEWDYRLTFVDRPAGLAFPAFDRFRAGAFHATHAYPPAGETLRSIPALMAGRFVITSKPNGVKELDLTYAGEPKPIVWGPEETLFSSARRAGINSAVAGWYIPYCRVLGSSLAECTWEELVVQRNSMGDTFSDILPNQARSLLETNLLSVCGQSLPTARESRLYQSMLARAEQLAQDPSLGLVFVHMPVTHVPYFYDHTTKRPTLKNSLVAGYRDSLELADRTFAALRRTMERAGTWENTAILLTADHWFRQSASLDGKVDHRVPYLLKLAGQNEGVRYDSPFNTVLTHDLLLRLLRNELETPQEVMHWLDVNRSIAESPYN